MKEVVLNHPLITHKLSILRDKHTGTKEFREIISEISILLCYEATKDAKLMSTIVETPLEKYKTKCFNNKKGRQGPQKNRSNPKRRRSRRRAKRTNFI